MDFLVRNRLAVVTGGSSGIGLEAVRLLLQAGAKVAFCGRNSERLNRAENQLRSEFPNAQLMSVECDVLDLASCHTFASTVEQQWGAVDMLIANAGQGYVSSLDETPDDAWLSETQLKLFGVLNPLKAFRSQLAASDIGSLTCVNSLLALQPEPHMIATSAARAALLNMTHNLAHELIEDGIRVNSILLGMVESGQWRRRFEQRSDSEQSWEDWIAGIARKRGIPMGRLGRPEEPARALVFLASPMASFTTGAALDVSGGFNRHL